MLPSGAGAGVCPMMVSGPVPAQPPANPAAAADSAEIPNCRRDRRTAFRNIPDTTNSPDRDDFRIEASENHKRDRFQ
jgi:hypothetical protein